MKDYSNFSANELAQDVDFIQWVVPGGNRDEHYDTALKTWLDEHPKNVELVDEARKIVLAVYSEGQYDLHDTRQEALWARIDHSTGSATRKNRRKILRYAVAASVMIVLLATFSWTSQRFWNGTFDHFPGSEYIVFSNTGTKPHSVVLEDGSVVVLKAHSTIRYPESFSENQRNVYLQGEAFFRVTKDAAKPFSVFANNVVTRVLGTSFTVRAYDDDSDVVVAVKSGKVSVFRENRSSVKTDSQQYLNGVLLTPNQQISVSIKDKELRMLKSIVEQPIVVDSTLNENFLFNDTPIHEVFKRFEKAYGVKIVYDEEVLSGCLLNTSLKDVAFYDQLRMICRGINAEFEIVDANVIVKGGGCE